jgi:hypothetical protein
MIVYNIKKLKMSNKSNFVKSIFFMFSKVFNMTLLKKIIFY